MDKAIAIKIGKRFFTRISKGGVQTAWSLAGGKLFTSDTDHQYKKIEEQLNKRGKKFKVVTVSITSPINES